MTIFKYIYILKWYGTKLDDTGYNTTRLFRIGKGDRSIGLSLTYDMDTFFKNHEMRIWIGKIYIYSN